MKDVQLVLSKLLHGELSDDWQKLDLPYSPAEQATTPRQS